MPLARTLTLWFAAALLAISTVTAAVQQPVLVINRGVGGQNSDKIKQRFNRDVIDLKPDHVVLLMGTNDVANSRALVPIDEYEQNLQWMLEQLSDAEVSHVVLVTIPPVMEQIVAKRHANHPAIDQINEQIEQYNTAIKRLAETHGADVADLAALVQRHGGDAPTKESLIRNPNNGGGPDGIHFTAEGYRLLGELVAETFAGKIKAGDRVVAVGDSLTYSYPAKGQGTAFGQTYPAVLNNKLNEMVGVAPEARQFPQPSDKPRGQNLLINGDLEDTDDGLTPYAWTMWQHTGRYEGTTELKQADTEGSRYLQMTSSSADVVAYLLNERVTLPGEETYTLSLRVRGDGEVRVLMNQYDKARKFIAPSAAINELAAWRPAEDAWQTIELTYTPADNVDAVQVALQVRGEVCVDDVTLWPQQQARALPPVEGEPIVLENEYVRVAFYAPAQGGGLRSIQHPSGTEFLQPAAARSLWRLHLRRMPKPAGEELQTTRLTLDPEQDDGTAASKSTQDSQTNEWLQLHAADAVAQRTAIDRSEEQVTLRWEGIDLPGEATALDVSVTATLTAGDRFVRFRTSIDNRSERLTAFYVVSPTVQGVYPADGKIEQDYLASPIFNGRLIHNPIANGILGKARRFQPNRSGHSMQFDAYMHGNHGLYLGCLDDQQNAKRYELTADAADGFGWAVVHIPDNMTRVPQRWQTPYDTVITCFDGDWYDACQLYRSWALQQSWTRKGPLHSRTDLPQWFRDIDDWLMLPTPKPLDVVQQPPLADAAERFSIGLWNTYWGKGHYFSQHSPDRFPLDDRDAEYLAMAKSIGAPVMAYLQAICWDTATDSFQKHNAMQHGVRDYDNNVLVWNLGVRQGVKEVSMIAWPGALWTNMLGDTIEQMAQAGMRAAYLDSFNHGGSYLNFNPHYADGQIGGGNRYIKSAQALLAELKRRARQIDPGFSFTAESFWEGNMAELDAYLAVNTTNQPLQGKQVAAIPMAHAVYHDHTMFYGGWIGRHDLEQPNGLGYFAKVGQMFVWGVKSGWIQPTHLQTFENHELAAAEYPLRLAAYAAGKDFLLDGTLLRRPRVVGTLTEVRDIAWYRGFSSHSYPITLPVVLHEAWRSPNGRVGLAFYNITGKSQPITVQLTPGDHGVRAGDPAAWRVLAPTDQKVEPTVSRDGENTQVSVVVPPRSPVLIATDNTVAQPQ